MHRDIPTGELTGYKNSHSIKKYHIKTDKNVVAKRGPCRHVVSVRHMPVLYQNCLTYRQTFFSTW